METLKKSQIETKKKKKYPTRDLYPSFQYNGNAKGLINIFRACKKVQLKTGRDFKEEYIMIRKRARSLNNRPIIHEDMFNGAN